MTENISAKQTEASSVFLIRETNHEIFCSENHVKFDKAEFWYNYVSWLMVWKIQKYKIWVSSKTCKVKWNKAK